jgi:hypothetical protein
MARNDLVQSGEIEIGSWRYSYGSHYFSANFDCLLKNLKEYHYVVFISAWFGNLCRTDINIGKDRN